MTTLGPGEKHQMKVSYSQHNVRKAICADKQTSTPLKFMVCPKCQKGVDCDFRDDKGVGEYIKALNYINSCHKMINQMMVCRRDGDADVSQTVLMPDLPNFMDVYKSFFNTDKNDFKTKLNQVDSDVNEIRTEYDYESSENDDNKESVVESDDEVFNEIIIHDDTDYKNEHFSSNEEAYEIKIGDEPTREYTHVMPNEELQVERHLARSKARSGNFVKTTSRSNKRHVILKEPLEETAKSNQRWKTRKDLNNVQEKLARGNDSEVTNSTKSNASRSNTSTKNVQSISNSSYSSTHTDGASAGKTFGSPGKKVRQRSLSSSAHLVPRNSNTDVKNTKDVVVATAVASNENIKDGRNRPHIAFTEEVTDGNEKLSQSQLDEFAKELATSENVTPRSESPVSRSATPKNLKRSKTPIKVSLTSRKPIKNAKEEEQRFTCKSPSISRPASSTPRSISKLRPPLLRRMPSQMNVQYQAPKTQHTVQQSYVTSYNARKADFHHSDSRSTTKPKTSSIQASPVVKNDQNNKTRSPNDSYFAKLLKKPLEVQHQSRQPKENSPEASLRQRGGSLEMDCRHVDEVRMGVRTQYRVVSKPSDFFTLNRKFQQTGKDLNLYHRLKEDSNYDLDETGNNVGVYNEDDDIDDEDVITTPVVNHSNPAADGQLMKVLVNKNFGPDALIQLQEELTQGRKFDEENMNFVNSHVSSKNDREQNFPRTGNVRPDMWDDNPPSDTNLNDVEVYHREDLNYSKQRTDTLYYQ